MSPERISQKLAAELQIRLGQQLDAAVYFEPVAGADEALTTTETQAGAAAAAPAPCLPPPSPPPHAPASKRRRLMLLLLLHAADGSEATV